MVGDECEGGADMRDGADYTGCDDHAGPRRTTAEIQDWMVTYIARETGVPPEQVDASVPFEHFALDSAAAVGMTGDLEAWLGRSIDPTIVYDYPTIHRMAKYLAGEAPSGPSG